MTAATAKLESQGPSVRSLVHLLSSLVIQSIHCAWKSGTLSTSLHKLTTAPPISESFPTRIDQTMDIDDDDDFYSPEEPQPPSQPAPAEAAPASKKDANEELESGEEEDEGGAMDEDEDSVCISANSWFLSINWLIKSSGHRHYHRTERRVEPSASTVSLKRLTALSSCVTEGDRKPTNLVPQSIAVQRDKEHTSTYGDFRRSNDHHLHQSESGITTATTTTAWLVNSCRR